MGYVIPPAGVSPASFFFAPTIVGPARPGAILADRIDPETGEYASVILGRHPVDAAVIDAFRLNRGTGIAVTDAGQRFRDIRKNRADYTPRQLKDEAMTVIQPFVDRGDVAVVEVSIDTEIEYDLGALYIRYTNLRSGSTQQVRAIL